MHRFAGGTGTRTGTGNCRAAETRLAACRLDLESQLETHMCSRKRSDRLENPFGNPSQNDHSRQDHFRNAVTAKDLD
jgi:hypothetical protein